MNSHDDVELRDLIRSAKDEHLLAPPADLWDRIAAETQVTADMNRASVRRSVPLIAAIASVAASVAITAILVRRSDDVSRVSSTAQAGSRITASSSVKKPPAQQVTVVSRVELTVLDDSRASATAKLETVGVGRKKQLVLSAKGLVRDPGAYYEVWLIDSSVKKLISLGPLRSDGTYSFPAGIDPKDYPVVDVSTELLDGNPSHSGKSILRGTLEFKA
ncbi:MAG: anti-sigma factor [Acidimicrobiia bacterium]